MHDNTKAPTNAHPILTYPGMILTVAAIYGPKDLRKSLALVLDVLASLPTLGLCNVNWLIIESIYVKVLTCGLSVETVPLCLADSGAPSPFLLTSGNFLPSSECPVSALEIPSCLLDVSFELSASFTGAGYLY